MENEELDKKEPMILKYIELKNGKKPLDHYTKRAVNESTKEDTFDIEKLLGKPVSEVAEDVFGYLGDTVVWDNAYNALAKGAKPISRIVNNPKEIERLEKAKMDLIFEGGNPENSIPKAELMLDDPLYTPKQRQELFYQQLIGGKNRYGDPTSITDLSRSMTPEYKKRLQDETLNLSKKILELKGDRKKAALDLAAHIGIGITPLLMSRVPELNAVFGTNKLASSIKEKVYDSLPDNVKSIVDAIIKPVTTSGKAIEGKIFEGKEKQLLNDFFEHQKPDQVDLEDWAKVQNASKEELDELIKKYKDQLTEKYY